MVDLSSIYRRAEEHTRLYVGGLFVLLLLLIIFQSIFSPTLVLAFVLSALAIVVAVYRPLWILVFLSVYLPFETIVLKLIPNDFFVFARYGSEGLIYLIAIVVVIQVLTKRIKRVQTTLDTPFVLLCVSIIASSMIHFVPAEIALLGTRQILRFIIVFFTVVHLRPNKKFVQHLTLVMFGIILIQSVIAIIQAIVGTPLDILLLPTEDRTLGGLTLVQGVQQFWEPGSRVFATLGRYDRLGNFLYVFLLLATGFVFTRKSATKKIKTLLPWIFVLGIPTLVLTFSRASWFAFLIGFVYIGVYIMRDKRVLIGLAVVAVFLGGTLIASGLRVSLITEGHSQTLVERFYESFSLARWRGEYYGLGRTYWLVHTPLSVISASPIFGWGPGQFGGGAVATLHNTTVYEAVGEPYGVFGTEGFIDNNWFSLWGELGTLGLGLYLWLYSALFVAVQRIYYDTKDRFVRGLSLGVCAILLAVAFNALTSTVLEIRTLAFYLWLYGGFVYVLSKPKLA